MQLFFTKNIIYKLIKFKAAKRQPLSCPLYYTYTTSLTTISSAQAMILFIFPTQSI